MTVEIIAVAALVVAILAFLLSWITSSGLEDARDQIDTLRKRVLELGNLRGEPGASGPMGPMGPEGHIGPQGHMGPPGKGRR